MSMKTGLRIADEVVFVGHVLRSLGRRSALRGHHLDEPRASVSKILVLSSGLRVA